MTDFQRGFELASDQLVAAAVGARVADYGARVEESLETLIRDMAKIAVNQKDLHYAKGDVVEIWHAGTLNLNATQRGLNVEAFAPRNAGPIDVAVSGESGGTAAQLKYYRSGDATAKAISDPKYQCLDSKVVPADQLDAVRAAALRLASKNAERPEVASSYRHTAQTADDRLRMDGAESRPLSEDQAFDLTRQLRSQGGIDRVQFGLSSRDVIQWQEVLRDAAPVAVRAALLAAALQAAPLLMEIAKQGIESGEISVEDFAPLGQALPAAVLRSGLAGGLTAAVVGAAQRDLLGASLMELDPTVVGAIVVLCISAAGHSVEAARGRISPQEAAARTAEDALTIFVSLGFAAVGQALIPIPLLGALVGNIVGALVARLVIDQANEALLGLAVETGWTFFGLVDQDYRVPESLLADAGWQTINMDRFEPRTLNFQRLEPSRLDLVSIDVSALKRGVVAFRRVGFIA